MKQLILAKGFTLIELLVVITLLGILAAGVLVAINPLKRINQATDSLIKSDISQLTNATQAYFTLNQSYPSDLGQLVTNGDLKTQPKIPNTNSFYSLAVTPSGCTGNAASPCSNVAVYAPLNDMQTSGNVWCWRSSTNTTTELPSATCQSTLDQQADIFSIGNSIQNGSFETDSNSDGLADNWNYHRTPTSVTLTQSPTPKDDQFVQKIVVNGCCYQGIKQTISNLKPNTRYIQTAWMYLESGHGTCSSVGVGMQSNDGETFVGCDRLDQWVQLTLTGTSDASGNYFMDFQNWTSNAYFYVDAVRLVEAS